MHVRLLCHFTTMPVLFIDTLAVRCFVLFCFSNNENRIIMFLISHASVKNLKVNLIIL